MRTPCTSSCKAQLVGHLMASFLVTLILSLCFLYLFVNAMDQPSYRPLQVLALRIRLPLSDLLFQATAGRGCTENFLKKARLLFLWLAPRLIIKRGLASNPPRTSGHGALVAFKVTSEFLYTCYPYLHEMTLWSLLQAGLLMTNSVAILNNERFLDRYGLGFNQMQHASPLGKSIIGGIHAVQYFRSILVILNTLVVIIKLLFG